MKYVIESKGVHGFFGAGRLYEEPLYRIDIKVCLLVDAGHHELVFQKVQQIKL
jgi:hypothetical protein